MRTQPKIVNQKISIKNKRCVALNCMAMQQNVVATNLFVMRISATLRILRRLRQTLFSFQNKVEHLFYFLKINFSKMITLRII